MEEFELESGEQVLRAIRKHWLIFVFSLLPYAIFAVLPIVLLDAYAAFAPHPVAIFPLSPLNRFALGLWWLFTWCAAFKSFIRYFLNQWVVTTQRIVDIRQYGFFDRRVSSFLLARVQDVTTDVSGFLPTIIGLGSINVETAGREEKFIMNGLADPEGVRDLIMRETAALRGDPAAAEEANEGV